MIGSYIHYFGCYFPVTSYTDVWIEICALRTRQWSIHVTSYTDVWIEMVYIRRRRQTQTVTSYTDVWIEIGSKD
jgi:hypothetical protein